MEQSVEATGSTQGQYEAVPGAGLDDAAQYASPMASRIRSVMHKNARETMQLIELRTTPQGHPVYRQAAQMMHGLIDREAGHHAIAAAMAFVDHSSAELERSEAERRGEARRTGSVAGSCPRPPRLEARTLDSCTTAESREV